MAAGGTSSGALASRMLAGDESAKDVADLAELQVKGFARTLSVPVRRNVPLRFAPTDI
jgi:hypothetical protein